MWLTDNRHSITWAIAKTILFSGIHLRGGCLLRWYFRHSYCLPNNFNNINYEKLNNILITIYWGEGTDSLEEYIQKNLEWWTRRKKKHFRNSNINIESICKNWIELSINTIGFFFFFFKLYHILKHYIYSFFFVFYLLIAQHLYISVIWYFVVRKSTGGSLYKVIHKYASCWFWNHGCENW